MCARCRGADVFAIANCLDHTCPLHAVRPNQTLAGKQYQDYDQASIVQETLDALELSGLSELEKLYVPSRH